MKFYWKSFDIFLNFAAQRKDCGYMLTSTNNLCFVSYIRKMYTPVYHNFIIYKWDIRGMYTFLDETAWRDLDCLKCKIEDVQKMSTVNIRHNISYMPNPNTQKTTNYIR